MKQSPELPTPDVSRLSIDVAGYLDRYPGGPGSFRSGRKIRDIHNICALGFAFAIAISIAFTNPVMADNPSATAPQIKVPSTAWRKGADVRAAVEFPPGQGSESAAWSSDSARVAGTCNFGNGFVIDAVTGRRLTSLPAMQLAARAILFTPDDKHVLVGHQVLRKTDNRAIAMTLIDPTTGAVEREIEGFVPLHPPSQRPTQNAPTTIAFDRERAEIVIMPQAGLNALEAYDPTTWQAVVRPLNAGGYSYFALRPHSRDVALPSSGTVLILDRLTGIKRTEVQAMPANIEALAYSPDGSLLLTGMLGIENGRNNMPIKSIADANRHRIVGWRAEDLAQAGAIDVDLPSVYAVAFHPDGGLFAVGTYTGVVLFDSTTFAEIVRIKTPATYIHVLAFSPDGSALGVGGGRQFSVVAPR